MCVVRSLYLSLQDKKISINFVNTREKDHTRTQYETLTLSWDVLRCKIQKVFALICKVDCYESKFNHFSASRSACILCLWFVGLVEWKNERFYTAQDLYHLGRNAHGNSITRPRPLQNSSAREHFGGFTGLSKLSLKTFWLPTQRKDEIRKWTSRKSLSTECRQYGLYDIPGAFLYQRNMKRLLTRLFRTA